MYNDAKPALTRPVTWILVADGKRARIYVRKRTEKGVSLIENQKYGHNEETKKPELIPVGAVFHAKSPEACKKGSQVEPSADAGKERFAKIIATYLNTARTERQFNRLVLIAPARLLGELRQHLHKTAKMSVIAELDKDLIHYDSKVLATHLEDIA
jgi:protein required for attachment to host cells